jgi:hypothetical protein
MATDRRCPRRRARGLIGAVAGALTLGATPALAVSPVPAGARDTAAILLKFSADQAEPFTVEQVRSAVFTGSSSAAAFHGEQSFGRISLTGKNGATSGDVFGWYTIAGGTSTCDPDAWMALADAQATGAGVDLSGYEHRAYFFPQVAACGWAGLADVRGPISFMNGTISTRVIAHELGHNLGSFHAASLRCVDGANAGVTVSASCTSSEYGDPFDVMGSSGRHQSVLSKVRYGFIPAANEVTASATGTHLLQPSSTSGTGVQSLRIRRGTSNAYWHFERRGTAGAFDSFLASDPAVNGVTVRLSDDASSSPWHTQTYLVDANPATTSLSDAPLPVGGTFTDPTVPGAPTVTVESNGPSGASLRVIFPGDPGPAAGGGSTTPPAGTDPGTTTPPVVTPPITTPTPAPTARVTVRRVSPTHAVARIRVPVRQNATCRSRIAAVTWLRCVPANGTATIVKRFRIRRSTVAVGVQLSGTVVLSRRFRIPGAVGGRRVTTVPIRAPHDHSTHPH